MFTTILHKKFKPPSVDDQKLFYVGHGSTKRNFDYKELVNLYAGIQQSISTWLTGSCPSMRRYLLFLNGDFDPILISGVQ